MVLVYLKVYCRISRTFNLNSTGLVILVYLVFIWPTNLLIKMIVTEHDGCFFVLLKQRSENFSTGWLSAGELRSSADIFAYDLPHGFSLFWFSLAWSLTETVTSSFFVSSSLFVFFIILFLLCICFSWCMLHFTLPPF